MLRLGLWASLIFELPGPHPPGGPRAAGAPGRGAGGRGGRSALRTEYNSAKIKHSNTYTYTYVCIYVFTYICIYTEYICIYRSIYLSVYLSTYIYIHIHTYFYVYNIIVLWMEEILHRLSISCSTCPRTPFLTLSENAGFWAFGQMT